MSHRSAAVIWGLSGFRPGPLEITVPGAQSGRRGLAIVHRSIELPRIDRTTHGRQYEIFHDGEFVARVDLGDPEPKVAVETDSFRWHAGRGPFRSDRVRGNRIAAAGWTVLRATPEDAADGRELLRAVGGILAVAA